MPPAKKSTAKRAPAKKATQDERGAQVRAC